MAYNICEICGAKDGRAGNLIGNESMGLVDACLNCHDTRTSGEIVVHSHLNRTEEEIRKMIDILIDISRR